MNAAKRCSRRTSCSRVSIVDLPGLSRCAAYNFSSSIAVKIREVDKVVLDIQCHSGAVSALFRPFDRSTLLSGEYAPRDVLQPSLYVRAPSVRTCSWSETASRIGSGKSYNTSSRSSLYIRDPSQCPPVSEHRVDASGAILGREEALDTGVCGGGKRAPKVSLCSCTRKATARRGPASGLSEDSGMKQEKHLSLVQ